MHVAGLHKRVNVSVHKVDRAATPFLSAVDAMPPHAHVQGPKTAAAKPFSSYHIKIRRVPAVVPMAPMVRQDRPDFRWMPAWYVLYIHVCMALSAA